MLTLAGSSMVLGKIFLGLPTGLVSLAVVFFIIAIVAYVVGAQGVAGMSAGIGRTLLFVFLILAVAVLVISFLERAT